MGQEGHGCGVYGRSCWREIAGFAAGRKGSSREKPQWKLGKGGKHRPEIMHQGLNLLQAASGAKALSKRVTPSEQVGAERG